MFLTPSLFTMPSKSQKEKKKKKLKETTRTSSKNQISPGTKRKHKEKNEVEEPPIVKEKKEQYNYKSSRDLLSEKWFAVLVVNTQQETRPVLRKTKEPWTLIEEINEKENSTKKSNNQDKANDNGKNKTGFLDDIDPDGIGKSCNRCVFEECLSLLSFMVDLKYNETTEKRDLEHITNCRNYFHLDTDSRENKKSSKASKNNGKSVENTFEDKNMFLNPTDSGSELSPKWFEKKGKYRIGQINGPFDTELEVDKYIEIWSNGNRGTISKAARGEVLAKQFNRETYGDLSAIFLNNKVNQFIKSS